MKLKVFFLLMLLLLTQTTGNAQNEINVYGNLEFGPHDVGLKQLTIIDTSKIDLRKIQLTFWYPSEKSNKRLKFSDYLNYENIFKQSELLQELSISIGGKVNLFSDDTLSLILYSSMKTARKVKPKKGKFPVLIWSMRYGTVEYQNIISEYISSHGFVVVFSEDIPNSPYPWQYMLKNDKTYALNQQIDDLNILVEYLKNQNNIDTTRVGLLSWSYAGESSILAQMSNDDIDLVVGLSSLGFSSGVYLGQDLATKVNLERLNVPYLMLSEKVGTNGTLRTSPDILDSMHPNSRYVTFNELAHGNFNAMEGMLPGILNTNKVQSWSKGGDIAQLGYEVICEITMFFIQAVFHEFDFQVFDARMSLLAEKLPSEFISIESPKRK